MKSIVWAPDEGAGATVTGKKKVQSSRRVKHLKLFRYVKREVTESRFTITCHRQPSGLWEILKETEIQ